jgi:hypothetical protein
MSSNRTTTFGFFVGLGLIGLTVYFTGLRIPGQRQTAPQPANGGSGDSIVPRPVFPGSGIIGHLRQLYSNGNFGKSWAMPESFLGRLQQEYPQAAFFPLPDGIGAIGVLEPDAAVLNSGQPTKFCLIKIAANTDTGLPILMITQFGLYPDHPLSIAAKAMRDEINPSGLVWAALSLNTNILEQTHSLATADALPNYAAFSYHPESGFLPLTLAWIEDGGIDRSLDWPGRVHFLPNRARLEIFTPPPGNTENYVSRVLWDPAKNNTDFWTRKMPADGRTPVLMELRGPNGELVRVEQRGIFEVSVPLYHNSPYKSQPGMPPPFALMPQTSTLLTPEEMRRGMERRR